MELSTKDTHVFAEWRHTSPLIACRFDPLGRYVFSSAQDYSLQRWEYPAGEAVSWEAHESWVQDFAFTPDGETMISAGFDERIIFWQAAAEKPQPLREAKAHDGWVRCLSVSGDGKLLASGGNDKRVKLYSIADGKPLREFAGHDSHVYSVLFHPDGKLLLSGDLSGQVHVWEIETGKLAFKLDAKDLHTYNKGQKVHYGGVRSLAISPDKKQVICGGLHKATNPLGAVNEPLVLAFDWESQKVVTKHVGEGVRGLAWQVGYVGDGSVACAAGGSGGGFMIFWKPGEEKPYHKFKLPDTLRGMHAHPDGIHLVTAHYDQRLRILRMAKKEEGEKKSG